MLSSRKRVAIIGSGVGGLSCAWLLSRHHEVELFESQARLGMDAHAVVVNGKRVDTPPRSFSHEYYPHLTALYAAAGVDITPFSWAFTYFLHGKTIPYLVTSGGATESQTATAGGYRLPRITSVLALLSCLAPSRLRALVDGYRLHCRMREDWADPNTRTALSSLPLRDYLERGGYSQCFVSEYLLPMLSMICTCDYEHCLGYPASVVVEYFVSNSSFSQFRTKHGTDDAAGILASGVHRTHLSSRVVRVIPATSRADGKPVVVLQLPDGLTEERVFDEIVFATDAANGAKLLPLALPVTQLLSRFEYCGSEVVVHTNEAVMPSLKRDWSSTNLCCATAKDSCMFTLYMSHPDNVGAVHRIVTDTGTVLEDTSNDEAERDSNSSDVATSTPSGSIGHLFMTWNPFSGFKEESAIQKIWFNRSVVTPATREVVRGLWEEQGNGRLWFVGAYTQFRIPLQESAVMSAVAVATSLGAPPPWSHPLPSPLAPSLSTATPLPSPSAQSRSPVAIAVGVACVFMALAIPTGVANAFLDGATTMSLVRTVIYFSVLFAAIGSLYGNLSVSRMLCHSPRLLLAVPYSLLALTVTWSLILRFFIDFHAMFSSHSAPDAAVPNVFVQAYVHVTEDPWGWISSSALLTWVIPGCFMLSQSALPNTRKLAVVLSAFLGAVSLGFPVFLAESLALPSPHSTNTTTKSPLDVASSPSHSLCGAGTWVFVSVIAFASVVAMPLTVESNPAFYVLALVLLHIVLVLPFAIDTIAELFSSPTSPHRVSPLMSPGTKRAIYASMAAVLSVYHISQLTALTTLSPHDATGPSSNIPAFLSRLFHAASANSCQLSISYDGALIALATAVYTLHLSRSHNSPLSPTLACVLCVCLPVLSPGAVLATLGAMTAI